MVLGADLQVGMIVQTLELCLICKYPPIAGIGGPSEGRTPDLGIKSPLLYQLS